MVKPKGAEGINRLPNSLTVGTLMYLFLIRFLESSSQQELYASDSGDIIESSEIACE